jgi:hypothetical protein
MNVGFGGKQAIPHPSKMTEGCLGAGAKLEAGDLQYFYFRTAEENGGVAEPPPWYKPNAAPSEYLGKAKGLKQILWEHGLWVAGMVERIADDDLVRDQALSITRVLSNCPDFANEITALQEAFLRRGHICIMSPKGHPELAGVGIEYSWVKSKKFFRTHNKQDMKGFVDLILSSMARSVVLLRTVWKFARKARAYAEAYRTGEVDGRSQLDVERLMERHKAHRNAVDFHGKGIEDQ